MVYTQSATIILNDGIDLQQSTRQHYQTVRRLKDFHSDVKSNNRSLEINIYSPVFKGSKPNCFHSCLLPPCKGLLQCCRPWSRSVKVMSGSTTRCHQLSSRLCRAIALSIMARDTTRNNDPNFHVKKLPLPADLKNG